MTTDTQQERPPERWAIVEIMGRRELAGRIHGDPPFGSGIIVDIPLESGEWAQEFYGNAAIFGVRIVPEASARAFAARSWHVKSTYPLALPAPAASEPDEPDTARMLREDERERLYADIDEALAQRDPVIDDSMLPANWTRTVTQGMEEAERVRENGPDEYRAQLVDVAARVVAAIEAHDRAQDEDDDEDDDIPFDQGQENDVREM